MQKSVNLIREKMTNAETLVKFFFPGAKYIHTKYKYVINVSEQRPLKQLLNICDFSRRKQHTDMEQKINQTAQKF